MYDNQFLEILERVLKLAKKLKKYDCHPPELYDEILELKNAIYADQFSLHPREKDHLMAGCDFLMDSISIIEA